MHAFGLLRDEVDGVLINAAPGNNLGDPWLLAGLLPLILVPNMPERRATPSKLVQPVAQLQGDE